MLARNDLAEHLLDHYGHCDRDVGRVNDCYWGVDQAGNWNGCLRVGWLGRGCKHWHPIGATSWGELFDTLSVPSPQSHSPTGGGK